MPNSSIDSECKRAATEAAVATCSWAEGVDEDDARTPKTLGPAGDTHSESNSEDDDADWPSPATVPLAAPNWDSEPNGRGEAAGLATTTAGPGGLGSANDGGESERAAGSNGTDSVQHMQTGGSTGSQEHTER
jgi:hypothetical protein